MPSVLIQHPDGWGLVRASNTQPVLVARCEAKSKEGLDFIPIPRLHLLLGGVSTFLLQWG